MLGCIFQYFYTSFLRFWLKWLLRQLTGKCELQRICAGYKPGAERTARAEYSLESSKRKVLRASVNAEEDAVEDYVEKIIKEKNVKEQKDPMFKKNLNLCLLQITGYKNLYLCVEQLRKEVFDSEKEEHEKMLLKLWDLLMPSTTLESRVTKQWGDIGFQGDDPKTDFRGMGMLGLTNLVFFSENYTEAARQVLSHANHPNLGYSYAIVGINLTEMAYSLLKSGALKPHFYNSVEGSTQMKHFHQLYCYLAYEFNKFWIQEEPESIMEFNLYREKFHEKVKRLLLDPDVTLILNLDSTN
ncbi:ELMO domain-containing protein 2 [Clupea harengus]|uniref:ELMO domain-containing protein 2 n=1 Tax=Clupea harengus TaxID=7950 RepID=A0A6P8EIP9_CLUHA|nr:ELMO domain-containing protein 2 [Clupea harengus]XP_031415891.1 ELMO domain-containing protein 2 [Clupea harengus]XP_031415893.1 ELMO domain-containing protein 2 [Clupea harengus]